MSLTKFVVKQPVMVNLLMLVVLVAGLRALNAMPVERNPSVNIEVAVVAASYPGASPEDVEKLITLPLEDRIKTLNDIDQLYASSYEGRAVIFIEYETDIEDYDAAVSDLQSEVERVKQDLPQEAADSLQVIKIRPGDVWSVMDIGLGGEYGVKGMKQLAESMRDDLLEIEGVKKVNISGTPTRQVWVEADRAKLQAYALTLNNVYTVVNAANSDVPAGRIKVGSKEYIFAAEGDIKSPRDIEQIVVSADASGNAVRVKDVATVVDSFARDEVLSRLNGRQAVTVEVFMGSTGSIVDIARQTHEIVAKYQARITDVSFSVLKDSSKDVINSVSALTNNALTGLILVAVLMTFLIGLRSAVLAVIGIPFAFLSSFVALHAMGETINTLSLFGFILVLGMVVDDAIIVIENVFRHLEMGKPPKQAAIEGTQEVVWPVISAVLTTIAAFLPLLLMEGRIGKFIYVLPVVAALALAGSLLEAIIVLPSHLAEYGRLPKNHERRLGDRMFKKLLNAYRRLIGKALAHRGLVVGGTVLATIAITVFAAGVLRIELFPSEDSSSETLTVRLPIGTQLEKTDDVMRSLSDRILAELPAGEIETITSLAGSVVEHRNRTTTTDGGMLTINFAAEENRRPNEAIKRDIRRIVESIPEIRTVNFEAGQHGPPVDSPVDIRVRGDSLDTMQMIAKMLEDDLRAIPGVSDVSSDFRQGKQKIKFHPDRAKMSAYGLTVGSLVSTLRMAVEGVEATSFRDAEDDEVKIVVLYREQDRDTMADLRQMVVSTATGASVPLSELGEFAMERTMEAVQRYDAKRVISVSANVDNETINSAEANRIIKQKYDDLSARYPGYSLEFGGEAKQREEAFGDLFTEFLIALILVYMILGSQFKSFLQPLVVMFTVPFSLLGVALGLIVGGLTFSLVAGISVVALAGVVVNDSLVLVDFANNLRRNNVPVNQAVAEAGAQRMRPILMTSLTTIAGLLPMALGMGGEGMMWQPMAICMIWGLGFATLLTLFVIPCTYSLLEDYSDRMRRLFRRLTGAAGE